MKIGFTAESDMPIPKEVKIDENELLNRPIKKSVVDVFFPIRNCTYSYFNDRFDLKMGDIVFVEGKLAGLRGRVTNVSYSFKIKPSDYKRVIGVADVDVIGEFHLAGSHFITSDGGALKYEQALSWFKAPDDENEIYEYSVGNESFTLNDLCEMNIKKEEADKGHQYYVENQVVYIELNNGKGRAIINGSRVYEVEFFYKDEVITGIMCDCYRVGACGHEFAAMLQLRDILDVLKEQYPFIDHNDYLAAIAKTSFFEMVIDGNQKGTITMG